MQSSEGPLDHSRPHLREHDLRLTAGVGAGITALIYAVMWLARDTGIGALFVDRGWIPPVVTWFTAWGLVVLFFKYRRLSQERRALGMDLLPLSIAEGITPEAAPAFVAHLEGLDLDAGNPVVTRLRRALLHFARQPDTSEVSRQLGKHAQAEADQVDSSYTLVRVFIWAVPILGFIGTVIGIGSAVGGFSDSVGGAADIEVMKESIGMVTSGLGVAFDTTLIALVMSIFLMFPSSSLQKSEEDFLALIEDYCDERLLPRLVDAREPQSDARVIQEAIAREMAAHHAELRTWQERLSQIGETLTTQVVTGWEKIDEQLRVRQQTQIEQLSRWASERQREASDELSETQRSLMRDFRISLEGMAAEARRLQEEGVHRIDDQLAGIERLHRRLQEDQQSAASAHREQSQSLASSAEQLSHTLARIRSEATEARDEGARQLGAVGDGIRDIADSARRFQQELAVLEESQARSLTEASERLGATLERLDGRLAAIGQESETRLREGRSQLEALDEARSDSRRRDVEVRDAQVAALTSASDSLSQTLAALRDDAVRVKRHVNQVGEEVAPALASQVESLAEEFAEPWRQQIAHIEKLHERLEDMLREAERKVSPSRTRRFFSRS